MENVRELLRLGADQHIVAEDHHCDRLLGIRGTPEDMARLAGHLEVAEFLREWVRSRAIGIPGEAKKAAEDWKHEDGEMLGVADAGKGSMINGAR